MSQPPTIPSTTTIPPTLSQPPTKPALKPQKTHNKATSQAGLTSWADRVRVSDSSTRFTLDPIPRQPVGQCLKITEQMLLENTEQWTRCMIGFFPGFKMPYHAVNAIASRVWRQCGLENVMTTGNGFMIFRFKSEEEMHVVLDKGPWMFGGKNIILQQWHPRYNFDKSKISTLPVWIRLHGLPFPLWSKQGLSLAASMVGMPLSCDELTYNCTRLEYARLCVEIDASLPFVHSFAIDCPLSADPITVTVDYEWKPTRCEQCKLFGHSCKSSTTIAPSPQITAMPTTSPTTSPTILHNTTTTIQDIPHPASPLPPLSTNIPPVTHSQSSSQLQPQPPPLPLVQLPIDDPQALEASDSSHDSGTEYPEPHPHHIQFLNPSTCLESKMDSLRTVSAASSAALENSVGTSPVSEPPDMLHSPSPSPQTVRKKKGGKKKKEAKGH